MENVFICDEYLESKRQTIMLKIITGVISSENIRLDMFDFTQFSLG